MTEETTSKKKKGSSSAPTEDPMDVDTPTPATATKSIEEKSTVTETPTKTPSNTSRSRAKPRSQGVKQVVISAAEVVGAAGTSEQDFPPAPSNDGASTPGGTNADGQPNKPKRGGSKPILKVSGISRVDNNLKSTLFQSTQQINQKNYYTDYLRRDDQIMYYREFNQEQKRQKEAKEEANKAKQQAAMDGVTVDDEPPPPTAGSNTIVIHMGSQNLRVGLASQAFPKVTPNVIAHRKPYPTHNKHNKIPEEDEKYKQMYEEYLKSAEDPNSKATEPDINLMFGKEFYDSHTTVYKDFRERMRYYKRRVIPNSHELVVGFNKRSKLKPDIIPDHNDPGRIEWFNPEAERWPQTITGEKVLRILPSLTMAGLPDINNETEKSDNDNDTEMTDAKPSKPTPKYVYELRWPIRHGMFNETEYDSFQELLGDISLILVDALESELKITFKDYSQYNVVFIIPDLYFRSYVDHMVALLLQMGLKGVAVIQESMAATFGAGVSTACVIDIGAQTSSVACVEEGMIIPDSRVNLKFGGEDVTLALVKLLLMSSFPYAEIDLNRSFDFQLAEDLKIKYATTNDADITVQLYSFVQRAPGEDAKKFQFKVFEEVMLAPLGVFYPGIFEQHKKQLKWAYKKRKSLVPVTDSSKNSIQKDDREPYVEEWETVPARFSLFPRSIDIYDSVYNDPESAAQKAIAKQKLTIYNMPVPPAPVVPTSTNTANNTNLNNTANNSVNGSTAVSVSGTARNTPGPTGTEDKVESADSNDVLEKTGEEKEKEEEEEQVPEDPLLHTLKGLDHAIIESITQAALYKIQSSGQFTLNANTPEGTTPQYLVHLNNNQTPFYENLLVVGGACSKLPGFNQLLTDRIGMWLSHAGKDSYQGEIAVMPAPREMDPQVLTWKGGGVFAKLKIASECWITLNEWDMLGNRALQYKTLFAY